MTEPEILPLITQRRARMAMLGTPSSKIKNIWIVFHGYRQLAPYFIRKFTPLLDEESLIFAPEGLSRFYLPGHQRVGASWMTKEDRLNEIADQQAYLNSCWTEIQSLLTNQEIHLHILGFSQGAATAWRWMLQQNPPVKTFVIWASKPPEEYSQQMDQLLKSIPLFFIYGHQDEFINPGQGKALSNFLSSRYPNIQVLTFDGKHDIDPSSLHRLKQLL